MTGKWVTHQEVISPKAMVVADQGIAVQVDHVIEVNIETAMIQEIRATVDREDGVR